MVKVFKIKTKYLLIGLAIFAILVIYLTKKAEHFWDGRQNLDLVSGKSNPDPSSEEVDVALRTYGDVPLGEKISYKPDRVGIATNGGNSTGVTGLIDNNLMYDKYGISRGTTTSQLVNSLKNKYALKNSVDNTDDDARSQHEVVIQEGFTSGSGHGNGNGHVVELFTGKDVRTALTDNPKICPFEYIRMTVVDNKFIIKSKLLGKSQPEPDDVYDTYNDFAKTWSEMTSQYPNLKDCGNPFEKYYSDMKKKYRYDEEKNISRFRDLKNKVDGNLAKFRTTQYISSQTQKFGSPDTPASAQNLPGEGTMAESFESGSIPKRNFVKTNEYNSMIELTHNCNVHLLEKDNQIGELNRKIDQLTRELTRTQTEFNELNLEMAKQTQEIAYATTYNDQIEKQMTSKDNRIKNLENLYHTVENQRNSLELQLQQVRKQMMNRGRKDGYIYMNPTDWTMPNNSYPPMCVGAGKCVPNPTVNDADLINDGYQSVGMADWQTPPFVS